jgi:hypothetical protein
VIQAGTKIIFVGARGNADSVQAPSPLDNT